MSSLIIVELWCGWMAANLFSWWYVLAVAENFSVSLSLSLFFLVSCQMALFENDSGSTLALLSVLLLQLLPGRPVERELVVVVAGGARTTSA